MQDIKLIVGVVLMLIGTSAYAGKIYKWVDSDGGVHYTESEPTKEKFKELQVQSKSNNVEKESIDNSRQGGGVANTKCVSISCQANKLESERLQREQERKAKQKQDNTQIKHNRVTEDKTKALMDEIYVKECKRRNESFCDESPEEIRKKLQQKHFSEELDEMHKKHQIDVPRYNGNDVYIN